jgi:hypothetical protein
MDCSEDTFNVRTKHCSPVAATNLFKWHGEQMDIDRLPQHILRPMLKTPYVSE